MLVSSFVVLAAVLVNAVSAAPSPDGGHKDGGMKDGGKLDGFKEVPILCPGLKTEDHGCVRYTQGFDVTGVVTTLRIHFPEVKTVCDCIQECLDRPMTCANYIWKFEADDPKGIKKGHRTCIIYSNFNLPSNVTVVYDANNSSNVNIAELEDNPQEGSLVPQTFKDVNQTVPDDEAFSGPVWQLSNSKVQC